MGYLDRYSVAYYWERLLNTRLIKSIFHSILWIQEIQYEREYLAVVEVRSKESMAKDAVRFVKVNVLFEYRQPIIRITRILHARHFIPIEGKRFLIDNRIDVVPTLTYPHTNCIHCKKLFENCYCV